MLYDFAGKVGDIVDRTIDEPFYKDIDAFATAMRDLSITDVKTKNRIGAKETVVIPGGYSSNTMEVPKAEVSLEDLFSGSNAYAKQMKEEYDNWKLQNPDEKISEKDYEQAVLHSRAFQYDSIHDGQEKKEFWGQIAALTVVVGASIICPPAGMALGAAYGTLELSSAVSGKDWISGRELGTGERVFRGVLAPLDVVPGVSGLAKFSSTVRMAHLGDVTELGLKTGLKAGIQRESRHVANMVIDAGKDSAARIRSAKAWAKEIPPSHLIKNTSNEQIISSKAETAAIKESEILPGRKMGLGKDYSLNPQDEATHQPFVDWMSEKDARRYNQFWKKVEIGMSPELRVATNQMNSNSFVNTELLQKLREHHLTYEEFLSLKFRTDYDLLDKEKRIMQDIRDSVPRPDIKTVMVKNIPTSDIQKYLDGQYSAVKGFVAKAIDSEHIHEYSHLRESLRMDYSYYNEYTDRVVMPYPENRNSYGYIKFRVNEPDMLSPQNLEVPYGGSMKTPYSGWQNNEWPWTGNGFTSSRNGETIPEWNFSKFAELKEGSELHMVIDGKDEIVGIYEGDKFIKIKR